MATGARTGGEPSGAHWDHRAEARDTAGGPGRYTNTGHGAAVVACKSHSSNIVDVLIVLLTRPRPSSTTLATPSQTLLTASRCRPTTTADFGSSFRQIPYTSHICLLEEKIQDRGMYLFTISDGSYAMDSRSGDG